MDHKITQETFNDAVKENIDVLGLSEEEAVEEAAKQFELQGVDLSNIVKKLGNMAFNDGAAISEYIEKLGGNDSPVDIIEYLTALKDLCAKDIDNRVYAGKLGAYDRIINLIQSKKGQELEIACLEALIALMTKQPDLLDDKGVEIIVNYAQDDLKSQLLRLKWTRECCILHEMNRQNLFNAGIVDKLKVLLNETDEAVLKEVLGVLRCLILDDDVRVEFGKAHEHARYIAGETLSHLTSLIQSLKSNANIVSDLILTVSSLLVRNEFCEQFVEENGLEVVRQVMVDYSSNEKINRQCFKLIKALTGNDNCKAQIIAKDFAPLITDSLARNVKSAATSTAGLACLAGLCLRSPSNSKVIFETDAPEVIIQVMKTHPKEKIVQKTGSWAIRNMVSRSKYQCEKFIELGAENVLREAQKNFKECEYDIKAALRDLGCDVELKEEWTGKGGWLNHSK